MGLLLVVGACCVGFAVFGLGGVFNYREWRDRQTERFLHHPYWRILPRSWRTETNALRVGPRSLRLLGAWAVLVDLAVFAGATFAAVFIVTQIATGNAG